MSSTSINSNDSLSFLQETNAKLQKDLLEIEYTRINSFEITALLSALLSAKAQFKLAKRSGKSHGDRTYATYEDLVDATKDGLFDNDLIMVPVLHDGQNMSLIMTLWHTKSGQFIRSSIPVSPADPNDPQSIGSVISYMERYSYKTLLGIQEEPKGSYSSRGTNSNYTNSDLSAKISPEQIKEIQTSFKPDYLPNILNYNKVATLADLTLAQYQGVMKYKKGNNG